MRLRVSPPWPSWSSRRASGPARRSSVSRMRCSSGACRFPTPGASSRYGSAIARPAWGAKTSPVCLALLLALGAGLLVRSLRAIEHVDPGFAQAQVFALQVFAWDRNQTPQKRAAFFEQTLERMRAQPGVAAAGAVSAMPFIEANVNIRSPLVISGQPAAGRGDDTGGSVDAPEAVVPAARILRLLWLECLSTPNG